MRASEIVNEVNTLTQKKSELYTVLSEASFGEAQRVLQEAYDKADTKLKSFLDMEFEPLPVVIRIAATPNPVVLSAGNTVQLTVNAVLSNGTQKDVTKERYPVMFFKDYDQLYNNTGTIVSVDVSDYVGTENREYNLIKTDTGFDVDDDIGAQGLHVLATANPNEYQVVDFNGNPLGLKFTTDGNVQTGDNWIISILMLDSGTTYTSVDESIATVNEDGLVTAVANGFTTIRIQNGTQEVIVPVTVSA
jgi:hypothetical protein